MGGIIVIQSLSQHIMMKRFLTTFAALFIGFQAIAVFAVQISKNKPNIQVLKREVMQIHERDYIAEPRDQLPWNNDFGSGHDNGRHLGQIKHGRFGSGSISTGVVDTGSTYTGVIDVDMVNFSPKLLKKVDFMKQLHRKHKIVEPDLQDDVSYLLQVDVDQQEEINTLVSDPSPSASEKASSQNSFNVIWFK